MGPLNDYRFPNLEWVSKDEFIGLMATAQMSSEVSTNVWNERLLFIGQTCPHMVKRVEGLSFIPFHKSFFTFSEGLADPNLDGPCPEM